MTRTKKVLVTVAIAVAAAAAAGASTPAFADMHATSTPVTTDDMHATGVSE